MTSDEILTQLQSLKDQINNNFDTLYQAAPDAESKQQVADSLTAAKDAYYQALAHGITDLNPVVQAFADDLKKLNSKLATQLSDLKKFTATIGVVSDAIKTGAAIVTLAMV